MVTEAWEVFVWLAGLLLLFFKQKRSKHVIAA